MSYEEYHREIVNCLSTAELRHKYFKLFYDNMITKVFDESYITKLINSRFLEHFDHTSELQDIKEFCSKFSEKVERKCLKCNSLLTEESICQTCCMNVDIEDNTSNSWT